jgi:hypothetical protein
VSGSIVELGADWVAFRLWKKSIGNISAAAAATFVTEYNTRLTGYSTLICIVNMGGRGLVEKKFRPNCLKSENKWERWFTIIESREQIDCS